MPPRERILRDLAEYVGGRVIGDGSVKISRVSPIEEAGTGDITFLANPRYARFISASKASAIIVAPQLVASERAKTDQGFLEVAQPYVAFAKILQLPSIAGKLLLPRISIQPQSLVTMSRPTPMST